MGAKKQQKKHLPLRARTTRSKGKVISDPVQNTRLLTEQLRSLGLYAADTLGDGNCLFRALSDQLYGTPSHHLQLRKDICDWIEDHSKRYEPFCEDERGLSTHLQCMREQGTYGGHLELSAFAHRNRRNVKVIQPGLVYVIQWDAGGDPCTDHLDEDEAVQSEREKRRLLRYQKRIEQAPEFPATDSETDPSLGAVYVAYHDWEHFSSIRNLRGPHTGLPSVQEISVDCEPQPPSPAKKKPSSRVKSKPDSKVSKIHSPKDQQLSAVIKVEEVRPLTPSQIALPASRSSSPGFHDNPSSTLYSAISSLSPDFRVHRSPKRSFDESSGSSASEGIAKRTRSSHDLPSQALQVAETDNASMDDSTPGLSPPGSPAESTRSSSAASSLPSTPPASFSPPPEPERPLTRRQRKNLGLPKSRSALMAKRVSAGKIVIPGGRYKKGAVATQVPSSLVREARDGKKEDTDGSDEEWKRNGTGRVDVRGFRELKI